MLLVASSLADISGACKLLSGRAESGGHCYTLMLDASTYWDTGKKRDYSRGAPVNMRDPLTRVVRRGDSLASALEQMA